MAKISAVTEEKIFQIKQFLGLNENPDGDTKLSMGEAAAMENFRVTRDGNLQRRPGTALVKGLMETYTLEVAEEAQVVRGERWGQRAAHHVSDSPGHGGWLCCPLRSASGGGQRQRRGLRRVLLAV